ncbi:ThiF family adenylyltransferase [Gelria sp. Kuro-4]|uniref:ThiF family adenylyltransferase n=1 Tax=Gelria sp. Kuro-4 TaxID=2796927 RepID=UPI001BEDDA12|nr:ThiF family adenylyltransferase [Gelria sp. Kuro-4]MDI3522269.1 molybdopterin-synthase adenylyltransferase [Bacillota bacterium]BCV24174.1 thiamine/molybdopterin biosynthesis protein MoeB [Gelria sp. Kuro-4]
MLPAESRYSRQILVPGIGVEGQKAIQEATAVVIGLGALGSTVANLLARAGVGTLRLVDRDFVDWTNLQRQGLYEEEDARKCLPKAVAAHRHLARVNSEIRYESIVADVNPGNIEQILSGATVVVDGLDNFYTRALVNEASVKMTIPWIHGACVSTYGTAATIVPGETACYNCLFPDAAAMTSANTCDTVGILGPVAFAVASWEAAEALKILAGRKEEVSRRLMFLDLWLNDVHFVPAERNLECRVCGRREFSLLDRNAPLTTTSLCGRNAIQVVPAVARSFDFESTVDRLKKAVPIESNQYLLKFKVGQCELVVFRDGRAIVFGTDDPKIAKSLYGRYIGG